MHQSEQFSRQTDQASSEYDLPLSRDLAKQLKMRNNSSKSTNRLDYKYIPNTPQQNKQNYQVQLIDTLQLPLQMAIFKDFRKEEQLNRQNRPLIQRLFPEDKKSNKYRNSQTLQLETVKSSIKTDSKVYQVRISNELKKEVSKIYGQMDLKRIQSICSKKNHSQQLILNPKIKNQFKISQSVPISSSINKTKSTEKLQNKFQNGKTKYQEILDQVFNSNQKVKMMRCASSRSVKSIKTNAQLVMDQFNKQNYCKQTKSKIVGQVGITRSIKLQRHFSEKNIRENHIRKVSDSLKPRITEKQDKNSRNKQIRMIRKVLTQKKNKPKINYIEYKRSDCYLQKYYNRIRKMV